MASPVDTSVKHFTSDFPGAPVLNGVIGSGASLFEACLVTGFGLRTAVSLVVAGGVATMTLSSDAKNPNLKDSVILVDGVTGSMTDLNGEQKVSAATTTTLQFATALADGTATGTITVKTAPAGWEKAFSGTNKAAYRSTNVASLKPYLRLDDSVAKYMNIRMYETMTDIDTGVNQAPTVADAPTMLWNKSSMANTTAVPWDLFADSRMLYFCPMYYYSSNATYVTQCAYPFGDLIPSKTVDPYAVVVSGSSSDTAPYGSVFWGSQGGVSQGPTRNLRSYTGLGLAMQTYIQPQSNTSTSVSGAEANGWGTFPSPDGKIKLCRIHALDVAASGANCIQRGVLPGAYSMPMSGGSALLPRGTKVTINGRVYYCVKPSGTAASTIDATGTGFFDITGPWR